MKNETSHTTTPHGSTMSTRIPSTVLVTDGPDATGESMSRLTASIADTEYDGVDFTADALYHTGYDEFDPKADVPSGFSVLPGTSLSKEPYGASPSRQTRATAAAAAAAPPLVLVNCLLEQETPAKFSSLPIQVIPTESIPNVPVPRTEPSAHPSDPSPRGTTPAPKGGTISTRCAALFFLGLVLPCVCVAIVCGTGHCQRAASVPRATRMAEWMNHVTLTNRTIVPSTEADDWEDVALHWLMHDDPLHLDAPNENQWTQRYALLTLLLPYQNDSHVAALDECDWFGVSCEEIINGLFRAVTHVNLSHTAFVGTISPDVGLLGSLVSFDLSYNSITGSLPTAIGNWARLKLFQMDGVMQAAGPLPTAIGQWTALTFFSMSNSGLTGPLPSTMEQWIHMRHFNVRSNALTGEVPTFLGAWTQLEHFDIGHNALTGQLPESIGMCIQMKHFGVDSNELTGSLPESLNNWMTLVHFHAGNNHVTGSLTSSWGTWTSLQYFNTSDNILTGTIPESYGNWTALHTFDVNTNKLSGTLPVSLSQWHPLEYFVVPENKLNGSLSELFGQWSKLRYFDATYNDLTGSLPSSVGRWTQLERFEVADNAMTGSLPDSIGQWTQLETFFNLDRNNFTGSLPDTVGAWTNLTLFSVSSNHFTGTIPTRIGNWSNVHTAYFEGNNFTGEVPATICMQNVSLLVVDCERVECSCCRDCD